MSTQDNFSQNNSGPEDPDKTNLRASSPSPDNKNPAEDSVTQAATQWTQFSSSHSQSAGFAQARELMKQSQSGKGLLLKKRFLLEEVLGQGGMGTVYKTKDLRKVEAEDPNPYIATKVLNQDFKDHPDAFVTLQQETAKSQTLAHPNIVTVHDFDREGDLLFMTMELLEGQPLDQLIKSSRNRGLPKDACWRIAKDLCAGLAYAHQRQLIHADFKPGNVFVNTDGGAKILDFGIARAASKEAQKHKFDAGQLGALTPAYATIEMIQDQPLTFTDDVYALACVIYEMLAGRHPYAGLSAVEACQQNRRPKRLEGLTAQEWKALAKGLAVIKTERFHTITEFAEALFPKRKSFAQVLAWSLVAMSLSGAAWFAYHQYEAERQVQNAISEKMIQAKKCIEQQDFTCAIEQTLVVVSLDPDNLAAKEWLDLAEKAQREQADKMFKEKSLLDLAVQIEECLARADLSCAQLFFDKALTIDPHSEKTQELGKAITDLKELQNEALLANQQKIQQELSLAKRCLPTNNYKCVQTAANNVLLLDPANAGAIALQQQVQLLMQQAQLAQQQRAEVGVKVHKLIGEVKDCMNKKNYSCAIAKAESAVDLDPQNKEAMALKNRAIETQRKLKESGFSIK